MSTVLVQDIVNLAEGTDKKTWSDFFDCCYELGSEGTVRILGLSEPEIHAGTGQRVRTIRARIDHSDGSSAAASFHVGVYGDEIFTGYEAERFRDYYRITLPDGRCYGGHLWWEEDKRKAMFKAWSAVSPVKMAIWWATYARLLDGRPLVDGSN